MCRRYCIFIIGAEDTEQPYTAHTSVKFGTTTCREGLDFPYKHPFWGILFFYIVSEGGKFCSSLSISSCGCLSNYCRRKRMIVTHQEVVQHYWCR
jgi:hypothetical protein